MPRVEPQVAAAAIRALRAENAQLRSAVCDAIRVLHEHERVMPLTSREDDVMGVLGAAMHGAANEGH